MILADLVFIIIAIVTLAGALMAVLSGSLIYALIGLVTTMFGIAGFYIYLNAPFIAMMQILIYVGAVSILIGFAIMLAGSSSLKPKERSGTVKFVLAFIVSIISFFIITGVIGKTFQTLDLAKPFLFSTKDIGRLFFDTYAFPFELISLLIVVSIIGAVMLALRSRDEK